MYLEFLFRRAHSRRRVERMYWSGVNLNSFTTCSKEVTVGTTGPIGSGFPQFGLPRRFAIVSFLLDSWTHQRRQMSPACELVLHRKVTSYRSIRHLREKIKITRVTLA